jgi:hypothetical protein
MSTSGDTIKRSTHKESGSSQISKKNYSKSERQNNRRCAKMDNIDASSYGFIPNYNTSMLSEDKTSVTNLGGVQNKFNSEIHTIFKEYYEVIKAYSMIIKGESPNSKTFIYNFKESINKKKRITWYYKYISKKDMPKSRYIEKNGYRIPALDNIIYNTIMDKDYDKNLMDVRSVLKNRYSGIMKDYRKGYTLCKNIKDVKKQGKIQHNFDTFKTFTDYYDELHII